MKGTRLWQDTGSPLISGRSRRERPFWHQVLVGWIAAVVAVAGIAVAVEEVGGSRLIAVSGGLPVTLQLLIGAFAYASVPGAIGSVCGVWLARNMGWHRPWLFGAAIGVLGGLVWVALSISPLWR